MSASPIEHRVDPDEGPGSAGERDEVQPEDRDREPGDDDQEAREAEAHGQSAGVAPGPPAAPASGATMTAVP